MACTINTILINVDFDEALNNTILESFKLQVNDTYFTLSQYLFTTDRKHLFMSAAGPTDFISDEPNTLNQIYIKFSYSSTAYPGS